jgi:hypothetical protein
MELATLFQNVIQEVDSDASVPTFTIILSLSEYAVKV